MWEIAKREDGYTIWQGRDAEGRKWWTCTADSDGIAVGPIGGGLYGYREVAVRRYLADRQHVTG